MLILLALTGSVFLENNNVFKPLKMFISFINLDLGIETCFYHGMDSYIKMWLQIFFPHYIYIYIYIYLIILAISIIIAGNMSIRILRCTFTKSFPVLATLFLLSYTSVLRTVTTVLFSYSTITYLPSGHQQVVWSIDASVPLFGLKFTILFITCILLILLLALFNITLPMSRILLHIKIKNCFKSLLKAFHSSYKNKYYFWITIHIITRNLFLLFYIFEIKLRLILSSVVLIFLTAYQGYTHPYKSKLVNIQEIILLINLTVMYAVSYLDNPNVFAIVVNITISLAFFHFCIIVLHHVLNYTSHRTVTCVLRVISEKLKKYFSQKNLDNVYNIPEHNYDEFQDTEFIH